MNKNDSIAVFRLVNRFVTINEHIEPKNVLEKFIQVIKESKGQAKVGALFAFRSYIKEKFNEQVAENVFAKLAELGHIPNHPLSTYEGFLQAMLEMSASGASFGGAFSGAGDNATINTTGMAGVDRSLGSKKRKIDKILTRTL